MNSISFAALFCAATLVGQQAESPTRPTDPKTAQGWARFLAAHPGDWQVAWCAATGTPKAIWGPGLRLQQEPIADMAMARAHAGALLDRHADLLGRGESTFVPLIQEKVARVFVLVYRQQYAGLDVLEGRADFRIHDSGCVAMFGSQAMPIPAGFDTTPALSAEAAALVAYQSQGLAAEATQMPESRLMIWADADAQDRTPVRLAWEVVLDHVERKTVGRVYVDAHTGKVLEYQTDYHECAFGCSHRSHDRADARLDRALALASSLRPRIVVGNGAATSSTNVTGNIKAWTQAGLSPKNPLVNIPARGMLVQVSGGNSAYTDANGDFDIPHGGTTQVTVTFRFAGRRVGSVSVQQGTLFSGSAPVTPGTPANIQIYSSGAGQFDWAQSAAYWGTDDVNEYLRSVLSNPSGMNRMDTVRANVNLPSSCNAYYSGYTINFYAQSSQCSNTAYSTVIQHEWGHGLDDNYGGISQTDGLSEGWGDTIAIFRTGQPIVGQDFTLTGGIVRTALNTYKFPAGGGVHQQGQTWMGFNWTVRENLRASLGTTNGTKQAEKIVLGSIVANARNQPDAVREVFVLDDDDANLNNGTPNYKELEAAALSRNLPYPKKTNPDAATYALYGAGCSGQASAPLLYNAGLPEIGFSFQVNVFCSTPNVATVLFTGASKTSWLGLTLPFDLGVLGAGSCNLLASGEIQEPLAANAIGVASRLFALPNDATLVGIRFYNQYLVKDPGNQLGWIVSGGGEGKVGKR